MQATTPELELRHFVEELGLLFQQMGGTAILGRILGRLLVSVPEHQSLTELASYLGASKGSVSTATRQLLASGLIVKAPVPGSRAAYYRLRENAWLHVVRSEVGYSTLMRQQAERALALLADQAPQDRRRAEEMVEFYRFLEATMPRLLEDWLQNREGSP